MQCCYFDSSTAYIPPMVRECEERKKEHKNIFAFMRERKREKKCVTFNDINLLPLYDSLRSPILIIFRLLNDLRRELLGNPFDIKLN